MGQQAKVHVLKSFTASWESCLFQIFFFLSTILSPPRKSKEFSESNNKDNCKKLLVKAFDEPSKTVLVL